MPIEVLVKEATGLPDKYVDMAVSYIRYLQYQCSEENKKISATKRKVGLLANKFHGMTEDFDEIPDIFKEYV